MKPHVNFDAPSNCQGVVYKKTINSYDVHADGQVISCTIASRLRKSLDCPITNQHSRRRSSYKARSLEHTDPVAIGDLVHFVETHHNAGMIVEVLPRRNKLSRRSAVPMPTAHAFEQVIVANLDQVVPVFSVANPLPKWNMLDRYLVSAESASLPVQICINKLDLAQTKNGSMMDELHEVVEEYRAIGYTVLMVSAMTGEGLDDLRQALQGRFSALLGKSGVGKSSLLNALQPGLGLRVNEVSQVTGRGKHTTTYLEMFPLDFGGAVVDTPGVREFGLWEVDESDLALFFPEMRPFVGRCRFGLDCLHDEEPGCAIRKEVVAGRISPRRYQSYLRLKQESE